MSIVGTRPPLISETNLYELHHRVRLAIKPGITGMWQVSGRSDITDFEEVVRLDVFDDQGTEPWQPDCKDYKPLNVYGQTKLEGELAVSQTLEKYFIVRIAWVFGLNGKNFIKTIQHYLSWQLVSAADLERELSSWSRLMVSAK